MDYVYPTPSIFAWAGAACPHGSVPISDSVYQEQARKSEAIYCLFPSITIDANWNGTCPAGFAAAGLGRCRDERGPR